jgi:hypothetical protein
LDVQRLTVRRSILVTAIESTETGPREDCINPGWRQASD